MNAVVLSIFLVLIAAFIGGVIAQAVKLPTLLGVILAGIVGSTLFHTGAETIEGLAEIGLILLLFSVGVETSFEKLARVGKLAILGSILQMVGVTVVSFIVLSLILHIAPAAALVLSLGFSLSSTALIVKILQERGEMGTVQSEIMIGWCLVQDLAVIPMVLLVPLLGGGKTVNLGNVIQSFGTSLLVLGIVFLIGKVLVSYFTSFLVSLNNRELLVLGSILLALGVGVLVSSFGVSPALGAFLAGVVIAGTQENHAIFAETRPLRDLFSVLFFVTLGFLVPLTYLISNLPQIILLSIFVLLLKIILIFGISVLFGYKGKVAVSVALGLSQVGEFAFVMYLMSKNLGILDSNITSLGMAVTLTTLFTTPILFKLIVPIWRWGKRTPLKNLFIGGVRTFISGEALTGHVIICGYGRMGKWIGKTLNLLKIPYVVVDYNQKVIREARSAGVDAIYGDPSELEVLEAAGIKNAKVVILSLPDRVARDEIIAYCQTAQPDVKVVVRAHLDEDVKKLIQLKVRKVVQPEFEGAIAVIRDILSTSGRSTEDIRQTIKSLRLSHTMQK